MIFFLLNTNLLQNEKYTLLILVFYACAWYISAYHIQFGCIIPNTKKILTTIWKPNPRANVKPKENILAYCFMF